MQSSMSGSLRGRNERTTIRLTTLKPFGWWLPRLSLQCLKKNKT